MFSKANILPMQITISGENVVTKKEINVLGVNFDSKLQWGPQVCNALTKNAKNSSCDANNNSMLV